MAFSARVATAPTSAEIAKARLGQITGVNRSQDLMRPGLGTQVTDLQIIAPAAAHTAVAEPAPTSVQRAASRLSGVGQSLLRPFRAVRNAFLGAALVVLEAVPPTLAPVGFTLRHLPTLTLAALIVGAPALGAAFLWTSVPGWRENFPLDPLLSLRGLLSLGFLAGLYVALGFVAVIVGVILRSMSRGVAGSTKALASRGETAFEGEDDLAI